MNNRTIKVAIRHDITDKGDEGQKKRTGSGWQNSELTLGEFAAHVGAGFPFTHQFTLVINNQ